MATSGDPFGQTPVRMNAHWFADGATGQVDLWRRILMRTLNVVRHARLGGRNEPIALSRDGSHEARVADSVDGVYARRISATVRASTSSGANGATRTSSAPRFGGDSLLVQLATGVRL